MNQLNPTYGNQEIILKNRSDLQITGVKKLESLNGNEFFLDTVMGKMQVRGNELEMKNLDLEKEILVITGKVNSIEFLNKNKVEKEKGFLSKLFR
ncbi:MAG: sporulation protein YabP [Acholeplasmataceae bacterium]|nr:sporulation protein YabP [Acholeplasmataceae bacterium]